MKKKERRITRRIIQGAAAVGAVLPWAISDLRRPLRREAEKPNGLALDPFGKKFAVKKDGTRINLPAVFFSSVSILVQGEKLQKSLIQRPAANTSSLTRARSQKQIGWMEDLITCRNGCHHLPVRQRKDAGAAVEKPQSPDSSVIWTSTSSRTRSFLHPPRFCGKGSNRSEVFCRPATKANKKLHILEIWDRDLSRPPDRTRVPQRVDSCELIKVTNRRFQLVTEKAADIVANSLTADPTSTPFSPRRRSPE